MYRVLLYYKFVQIDDPVAFAAQHEDVCRSLGLLGRILIANEGINGTVSGTTEACDAYMTSLWADPRFVDIEFKVDEASEHAFKKLFVRVRPEIITLGRPLSAPVRNRTGAYLSPVEAKAMLAEEDVVFLDGRNQYESGMGHFRGALCPPVDAFRDIPQWIEDHRDELQGKRIVTYCTGGIRCEKLTAWMLDVGFEHVFQVRGGIVCYGKDPEVEGEGFEGVNVVFDDRVVTPVGTKARAITVCRECGSPSSNYVNCANVICNARIILCEACEVVTDRCCSEACREAPLHREKNQKLRQSAPK